MKLYRFSPILQESDLYTTIEHIHHKCAELSIMAFGKVLPNSGNMGIFCHYPDEYKYLISVREKLTEPSDNPNQKYFLLHRPIIIPSSGNTPETTYTHLYIRAPDPYRHHVGDIDYYVPKEEYAVLKQSLLDGKTIPNARIFPRADLDMIELYHPDIDVLAYLSTNNMTQKVRVKQT